eukprot:Em0063g16a
MTSELTPSEITPLYDQQDLLYDHELTPSEITPLYDQQDLLYDHELNYSVTKYTNPDVVDAELGKEITAGWIINDHINIMKAKIDLKSCLPPDSTLSLINNYANWIMARNYGAQLLPYLDDFLLVGPPGKDTCQEAMYRVLLVCDHAQHVSTAPSPAPPDKLEQLTGLTRSWLVIQAQGNQEGTALSHWKLHHHISLNALARADVMWWDSFLHLGNGVAIFVEPDKTEADSLQLFTDASGSLGFGTYFNGTKEMVTLFAAHLSLSLHSKTIRSPISRVPHTESAIRGSPNPCLLQFPVGWQIYYEKQEFQSQVLVADPEGRVLFWMGRHSQPMFYPLTFLHLIEQCGFNAAKFNTHRLRIGAASTAARAGLPSDTIQKLHLLGLPWDSHQTMTSISVWDTGRPNGDQCHPLVPVGSAVQGTAATCLTVSVACPHDGPNSTTSLSMQIGNAQGVDIDTSAC